MATLDLRYGRLGRPALGSVARLRVLLAPVLGACAHDLLGDLA